MNPLGAIFDCDGLLADTETPDYDAWRHIYEEQGLHLPIELWAQSIGTAKGHDRNDWHAPLAERIGPGYDREATQARRRAHYQAAIGRLTPMPGVLALLDALDEADIPCAVASNSERAWVDRVLDITGPDFSLRGYRHRRRGRAPQARTRRVPTGRRTPGRRPRALRRL